MTKQLHQAQAIDAGPELKQRLEAAGWRELPDGRVFRKAITRADWFAAAQFCNSKG